jgi:FkbM family methyltransferase
MKRTFDVKYYERHRKSILKPLQKNDRKYILFPNDNAVTSSLIDGWIYEPYIFHFINDNMIDLEGTEIIEVGANNGNFTIEFADLVGDNGKVHAFEAQRIVFQQLCGNAFLNGLDNIYAYNLAVGHENGVVGIEKVDYYYNGNVNFGDVHIVNESESELTIPIITLDSIDFNNISIIKIDVQGFEYFVIQGAEGTIKKHRPFIFIEIEEDQLNKYNFTEKNLIDLIESLDYQVIRFQKGIPYQTVSGVCLDCVCIPNEKQEVNNFIVR